MDEIVIDERYSFVRVEPSEGEMAYARNGQSLEERKAMAFVAIASAEDTLPLELIALHPNEIAALPASVKGRMTRVRYVGDAPLACVETDPFGNVQVAIARNSAIEVVYTVVGHRGRNEKKKKIFTTVI